MGHKLKKLGVGLIAVTALSLVIGSSALAAQFTAEKYPTTYEATGAEGSGAFVTEAGSTRCKKISASGTLSAASSTATISSTYSECTAFGFLATTVQMNGCDYLMHVTEGAGDTYKGNGDLVCPAGKEVFGIGGAEVCVIHIPPQTNSVQIEFTNDTANKRVSGKLTGSNIHYTVVKDGFGCPFSGTGTKTGAKAEQASPTVIGGKEKPAVID